MARTTDKEKRDELGARLRLKENKQASEQRQKEILEKSQQTFNQLDKDVKNISGAGDIAAQITFFQDTEPGKMHKRLWDMAENKGGNENIEALKLTQEDEALFNTINDLLLEQPSLAEKIEADLLAVQYTLRDKIGVDNITNGTEGKHISTVVESIKKIIPGNPLAGFLASVHDAHKLRPGMHLFLHEATSAVAGAKLLLNALKQHIDIPKPQQERLRHIFEIIIQLHGFDEFPYLEANKPENKHSKKYGKGFGSLFPNPPWPPKVIPKYLTTILTTTAALNAADAAVGSEITAFAKNSNTYVNISNPKNREKFVENFFKLSTADYITQPVTSSFASNLEVWGAQHFDRSLKYGLKPRGIKKIGKFISDRFTTKSAEAESLRSFRKPLINTHKHYENCVAADSKNLDKPEAQGARQQLFAKLDTAKRGLDTFAQEPDFAKKNPSQKTLEDFAAAKTTFDTAFAAYLQYVTQEALNN